MMFVVDSKESFLSERESIRVIILFRISWRAGGLTENGQLVDDDAISSSLLRFQRRIDETSEASEETVTGREETLIVGGEISVLAGPSSRSPTSFEKVVGFSRIDETLKLDDMENVV